MTRVVTGDITKRDEDAIVNAANEWMLGGGGVDGAIHRAAGPELLAACKLVPEVRPGVRCPTGEARITPAFKLKARWIIHTVGPKYQDGLQGEAELLAAAYRSSIALAIEHDVKSIAFPAISTGIFGYPMQEAAHIAATEVRAFPGEVVLVAFDHVTQYALESAVSAVARACG
jgi:O-acetyl-ADP-ribose deacetylase (regulator of RNase III)